MADEWVAVGRVGRPHGLDGGFLVERASDDPNRFLPGGRVYVARAPARIEEVKRAGGRLVLRLDRKPPRGATLELPASELPEAETGSYYVFRLVGLEVEEEGGRLLGRVQDVTAGVANDVLELDTKIALPMVEDCVRAIDLEGGRIVIAPGFADES